MFMREMDHMAHFSLSEHQKVMSLHNIRQADSESHISIIERDVHRVLKEAKV